MSDRTHLPKAKLIQAACVGCGKRFGVQSATKRYTCNACGREIRLLDPQAPPDPSRKC